MVARHCRAAELWVRTGTPAHRLRSSQQPGPQTRLSTVQTEKPAPVPKNAWQRVAGPSAQPPPQQTWVPTAGEGTSLPVSTRSRRGRPRHTGFRGSLVFVLPQEMAGANKKDAKKRSFHRNILRTLLPGKARRPPCLSPCPSRGARTDFCHQPLMSPNRSY